jgi:glycosyltransferase involved in cell wall biosynthesis
MIERIPTISVCLLTYNHLAIVRATIESVLAQTFGDFELILSDDCSTDDTWLLLQELAARDSRIKPVRTPRNLGMAGNANFAAAQARADFIALLHHDDLYAPSLLQAWLDVIVRHPDMGFVSNCYGNYQSDVLHGEDFPERSDGVRMLEQRLLRRWDSPFRGTALVRRSCWEAVGGMRERFGLLADVDLWMRLAGRWSVGYVNEPVITVRQQRPADYPSSYVSWSWPRLRLTFDVHGVNHLEHYGLESGRARLQWLYFRARVSASIAYWLAYALAKRRWDMLATSDEVTNHYELPPETWLRRGLARIFAPLAAAASAANGGTTKR